MAGLSFTALRGRGLGGLRGVLGALFLAIGVFGGPDFGQLHWTLDGCSSSASPSFSPLYVSVAWAPSLSRARDVRFNAQDRQDGGQARMEDSMLAKHDGGKFATSSVSRRRIPEAEYEVSSDALSSSSGEEEDAEGTSESEAVTPDGAPKIAFVHGAQPLAGRRATAFNESALHSSTGNQYPTPNLLVRQLRTQPQMPGINGNSFPVALPLPLTPPAVPRSVPVLPPGAAPAIPAASSQPVIPPGSAAPATMPLMGTLPGTPPSSSTQPPTAVMSAAPQKPAADVPLPAQPVPGSSPAPPGGQTPPQQPSPQVAPEAGGVSSASGSVEAKNSAAASETSTALPIGAIIGLVVFCVVAVVGLVTVAWCLWRDRGGHRSKSRRTSQPASPERAISVTLPASKRGESRSAIFNPTTFRSLTSRRFQSIEALPSTRMGRSRSGEGRTGASDTDEDKNNRPPKPQAPTSVVSPRSENGRVSRNFGPDGDTFPVSVSDDANPGRAQHR